VVTLHIANMLVRGAVAVARAQKRSASSAYAHMKVKKNNWIEVRGVSACVLMPAAAHTSILQQNEVYRENKFMNWTLNKSNIVAVGTMAVVIPYTLHYLVKQELGIREQRDVSESRF
jgi:hypothetical protein